jgi:hypothetical protein
MKCSGVTAVKAAKAFFRFMGKNKYTNADIKGMKEYGLFDLVPAMCRLDYAMAEAGGASEFVREYTLASGGPYCDSGYKRKR